MEVFAYLAARDLPVFRKVKTDWLQVPAEKGWQALRQARAAMLSPLCYLNSTYTFGKKVTWRQMWKVAEEVIRFGQEVASHRAVAVINHIGMFTALAQAAKDEQWIEVPNLGTGKKAKLFPKVGPNWMSFGSLCLDVVLLKVTSRMRNNRWMKILKVCNLT